MTEKSNVGMGYSQCPICGREHDEVVLLHTRLKPKLEPRQCVGLALCPEHQKLKDEGYIALIETVNQPRDFASAERTGAVAHVRSSAWPMLFDKPAPTTDFCFVEQDTIAKLQEIMRLNHITQDVSDEPRH